MPTAVTLDSAKRHLNITTTDDDDLLVELIAVATEWVEQYVGEFTGETPAPIRQAIRLLVAHHYENREAALTGSSVAELPLGVMDLLAPYRVWSFG